MDNNPSPYFHDLGPEAQSQIAKNEEAEEPPGENRQQEPPEAHLESRGCQHDCFKGGWRGQHGGKHQRPEFMLFERSVDFLEARGG